ncbi:DnaJ domain-containing protein [Natrarchaeobius sp. A-rgal3]|uniref:DnaJ domain-containing protein n=1 Tax=Natrarchaeobius versutus TaxID=1679078 RepID=UPI00350F53CD
MTADFYDLLEIPPDASAEEIKDAYREKVRIYHPDVNDDDRARSQFTAVKKANDILGDPVERRAYDRLGHETYVAKRTSGIPSPDVWADTDSSSTDTEEDEEEGDGSDERRAQTDDGPGDGGRTTGTTSSDSAGTGASSSADSESASDSTGTSRSRSGPSAGQSGVGSGGDSASAEAADTEGAKTTDSGGRKTASTGARKTTDAEGAKAADTGGAGTADTAETGTAESGGSEASGRGVSSTDGGTTRSHRTGGSRTGRRASRSSRDAGGASADSTSTTANPVVRWWRRQNFALPLIWLSVLVYAAGLGQFALANESAVGSLRHELAAAGASAGGLWTVLSSGRYGLETPLSFVVTVEPVAPALASSQWYLALAGVVVAAVAAVVLTRPIRRERLWAPISMDETILVSVALAVSTGLIGGPLLAGTILMPFLFGVVVYHTRRGPGWTPSYLYILPVLAPAGGFATSAAGYETLPIELVAFVVLPLVGALGLPLRATVRKHFDR